VTVCEHVTITDFFDSHRTAIVSCSDSTRTQIVPQPVVDTLNLVEELAPVSHRVTAACHAHVNRAQQIVTVVGRAKAGPHGSVEWTTIRCTVYSETGHHLFDESRTGWGDEAELIGAIPYLGSANAVRACASGEARWYDGHTGSDNPPC
jgi:hypothetical protein